MKFTLTPDDWSRRFAAEEIDAPSLTSALTKAETLLKSRYTTAIVRESDGADGFRLTDQVLNEWTLLPSTSMLHLNRVRLNKGGYDSGGHYWGTGAPLWHAWDHAEISAFFRAPDRQEAKTTALSLFPGASFYR